MAFYWVTFTNRSSGTVEGDGSYYGPNREESENDARQRAEKLGTVRSLAVLPYPADPKLDVRSECPSFCWNPTQCAGRTSCPRPRACDD